MLYRRGAKSAKDAKNSGDWWYANKARSMRALKGWEG